MENYNSDQAEGHGKKAILIIIAVVALGVLAIGGYYLLQRNSSDVPIATATPIATPLPTVDPFLDSDADTIPDVVEKAIGTDPGKADSDGDGFNDLPEIKSGYSPLVAGAIGKYTPEQLQSLKDRIKTVDAGFYDREFGAVAVSQSPSPAVSLFPSPAASVLPVAIKKCELPEKIGSYTKGDTLDNLNNPSYKKLKGILSEVLIGYSSLDLVTNATFDTDENAKAYLEEIKAKICENNLSSEVVSCKSVECAIGGVTGSCINLYTDSVSGAKLNLAQYVFEWREGKTVKTVLLQKQGDITKDAIDISKNSASLDKQGKDDLTLFVNQFKNCSIN